MPVTRSLALLWSSMVGYVSADLPVHCLKSQIQGIWQIELQAPTANPTSCGHKRPDMASEQPHRALGTNAAQTVMVDLRADDSAHVMETGNSVVVNEKQGSWTMVYDEGFELTIGENILLAFSAFDLDEYGHNTTQCGLTERGWYRDREGTRFGCWIGKQDGFKSNRDAISKAEESDDFEFNMESIDSDLKTGFLSTAYNRKSAADRSSAGSADRSSAASPSLVGSTSWRNKFLKTQAKAEPVVDEEIPPEKHTQIAQELNLMQLGWTAKTYKKWAGKTKSELNKLAGRIVHFERPVPKIFKQASKEVDRAVLVNSHGKNSPAVLPGPFFLQRDFDKMKHLPEQFSWQSIPGILQEPTDQGECGSCYAISSVRMLTARNRVNVWRANGQPTTGLSDPDHAAPVFSVEYPLSCAEFNQGCNGGYGFLVGRWSEVFGLVPEECTKPYNAFADVCVRSSESCVEKYGTSYKSANSRYVGGSYGETNEANMMQEIHDYGPIVVGFEPKQEFMYYNSGIFRSPRSPPTSMNEGYSSNPVDVEWTRVDHAVLAVGWGVETLTGEKYWILQNSWGKDWGEAGYFRMARGESESGIESIGEAADVVQMAEGINFLN